MGALARSLPVMVVGLLLFTILISAAFSNEMEEEEEQQMLDPRQVRFSFGLGKRSSPPLRPDVAKLLATMKAWGYSGPHGLFKRGKDFNSENPNDVARLLANIKAWGYGGPHGLFKRGREFDSEDPNDVARLLANIKAWGYASPHGLFKRGKDLAEDYQNEEIMQLLEEVGEKLRQIGQKSKRISEDEMGKRQPYGFGLGKRAAPAYDFGLGKRDFDPEAPPMMLMKRETKRRSPQSDNWALKKRFAFGLGKRAPYGFGLGK